MKRLSDNSNTSKVIVFTEDDNDVAKYSKAALKYFIEVNGDPSVADFLYGQRAIEFYTDLVSITRFEL